MEKIKITLKEFNTKYSISVMVSALQDAGLKLDNDELDYDSIQEILGNQNYVLYGPNGEEVLQMDGESDGEFIDLILEKFDIEGLSEPEI